MSEICLSDVKSCPHIILHSNTWADFCLHSLSDQPPTSFYLVRLISKTPCMVLRLGFPIGTTAHVRNKVLRVKHILWESGLGVQMFIITNKTKRSWHACMGTVHAKYLNTIVLAEQCFGSLCLWGSPTNWNWVPCNESIKNNWIDKNMAIGVHRWDALCFSLTVTVSLFGSVRKYEKYFH